MYMYITYGFEDLNRPILEGLEDCVSPPQVVDGIYCNGVYLYNIYHTHTYTNNIKI